MAEWAVHVITNAHEPATDDQWDDLTDALTPVHGAPGMHGDRLSAQVTVQDGNLTEAAAAGAESVLAVIRHVIDHAAQVVGIEVLTAAEFARRLDGPPPADDLVPTTEAGTILGVSRQRVTQLAAAFPDFPRPVKRGRALWWPQSGIRAFRSGWDRSPGPKRARPA